MLKRGGRVNRYLRIFPRVFVYKRMAQADQQKIRIRMRDSENGSFDVCSKNAIIVSQSFAKRFFSSNIYTRIIIIRCARIRSVFKRRKVLNSIFCNKCYNNQSINYLYDIISTAGLYIIYLNYLFTLFLVIVVSRPRKQKSMQ